MSIAMVVPEAGGPESFRPLEIAIKDPGPGEVRIRQTIVGVNFVDIYFRSGLYPFPGSPQIVGVEGAGLVEAVGAGVTAFRPGDRIAYAGYPLGGYSEVRILPEARLIHLPDDISDRMAGSTMLRGITTHMLLFKVYPVQPGDWILVHAAAGGLGQMVTRWAHRLGARVIGTVGSNTKIAMARSAGAEEVLLRTVSDWPAEARRIADGLGVHLALDGIGGTTLAQTLDCVRPFGVVASVGQPAGPIPPVPVEDLGSKRSIALFRPSALAYANDPLLYKKGASDLIAALQQGLVHPIGAEYPLRDASIAHADLEAGRTTGSVILTL
jgi:NADPH:quinone reductase